MIMTTKHKETVMSKLDMPNTATSQLEPRAAVPTAGEQLTPSVRTGLKTASWALQAAFKDDLSNLLFV